MQADLAVSPSLASPLPVTLPSPESTHFFIPTHPDATPGATDRKRAGRELWGPLGEKAGVSGCPSHAPLPAHILFFIGSEEGAAQPTGQFGSPQGSSGRLLRCQPCAEGCSSCLDATPCLVEEAPALRAVVLASQTCCMLAVFLSMLVSYRCRQTKARKAPHLSSHTCPTHPESLASTGDHRLPKTRT